LKSNRNNVLQDGKMNLRKLSTKDPDFDAQLNQLLAFEEVADEKLEATVTAILADVKKRGDTALLEYSNQFDRLNANSAAALELQQSELQAAFDGLPVAQRTALEQAAQRVTAYHRNQFQSSWNYTEADGTLLGQQVTPLDRVGLYVPGGKAAYPSSVLMNALPAKVAGVSELIMVVPTPDGIKNQLVLAAAHLSGVDRVFTIGGAQAVAALAYGTATIPRVDKIVGPGNAYVAAAKRRVFGVCGIDMIAGPSEILVICDGQTNPDWIAMDLFSQAEHDELAQAILLSPDAEFIAAVAKSVDRLLEQMPRREIIKTALENRGALIHVTNLGQACVISNRIAPEHLELSVENPQQWLPQIKHAGAIFLGRYTSESLGDYCAGPNHVLPTSGTARFSSPLGVYDFQKRSSLIQVSAVGAQTLGKIAAELAFGEGLQAHAQSALFRN
jgi:histidinol dehydrogenase